MSTRTDYPERVSSEDQRNDAERSGGASARGAKAGSRRVRKPLIAGAVLFVAAGVAAVAGSQISELGFTEEGSTVLTHTVRRGPLQITVTTKGDLESANSIDVKCEVDHWDGSKIEWIVPNGTFVEEGEKIIEFDPSAIQEEVHEEKTEYQQVKGAYIQAQNDYKAAKVAVEEYRDGLYVQQRQDLESQVEVAKQNYNAAKDVLAYTEKLFRKGFSSDLQLQAKRAAVRQAELALKSAETALRVLKEYTKEKTLTQLVAARDAAKANLDTQKEALALADFEVKDEEQQLENCTVYAPADGMIVYANDEDESSNEVQIKRGALVQEQQTVVRLPDLSDMQVAAAIHESKIGFVEPGMPATVTIRDYQWEGTVKSIANQPKPTSWFQADLKEYETIIDLPGKAANLKPGMSSQVEILVADLQDVLQIPVQCVVEREGQFYCWVQTPQGPQRRPIVLGRSNDKMIEIKDGLKEGEQVLLNPRAHVPEAREGETILDDRRDDEETKPPSKNRPKRENVRPGSPSDSPGESSPGGEGPTAARQRQNSSGARQSTGAR